MAESTQESTNLPAVPEETADEERPPRFHERVDAVVASGFKGIWAWIKGKAAEMAERQREYQEIKREAVEEAREEYRQEKARDLKSEIKQAEKERLQKLEEMREQAGDPFAGMDLGELGGEHE